VKKHLKPGREGCNPTPKPGIAGKYTGNSLEIPRCGIARQLIPATGIAVARP
jgi:hypothetical protein